MERLSDVWAFPADAGRAVALSARPASPSVQPRFASPNGFATSIPNATKVNKSIFSKLNFYFFQVRQLKYIKYFVNFREDIFEKFHVIKHCFAKNFHIDIR